MIKADSLIQEMGAKLLKDTPWIKNKSMKSDSHFPIVSNFDKA